MLKALEVDNQGVFFTRKKTVNHNFISIKIMACNIFKGLGTALVTPFKLDGSVDYDALQRIIDYQLQNGATFCAY